MPYCSNCGTEVGEGESYCAHCGEALGRDGDSGDDTGGRRVRQSRTQNGSGERGRSRSDVTRREAGSSSRRDVAGVSLLDGETILHDTSPNLVGTAAATAVLVPALPLLLSLYLPLLPALGLGGAFAALSAYDLLKRSKTRLVVTNMRVVFQRGLLNRQTREVRYEDMHAVTPYTRLIPRLLGNGSIAIDDGRGTEFLNLQPGRGTRFKNLGNYTEIAKTIRTYSQRAR